MYSDCFANLSFLPSSTLLRDFLNDRVDDKRPRPFVMRVFEDEMDETESEGEEDLPLVAAKRFNCDEHYLRCEFYFRFQWATLFDNGLF